MNTLLDIWPVIAFMGVQTVAITWWAATTTSRLAVTERQIENYSEHGDRMGRIEASIAGLKSTLEERLPKRRGT
jgi:hypothetical protein